jgi:predicted transglutaminase-like cysteine proteinase
MEAGWPSASLLITAVWYIPGGPLPDVGHAILTVTTDKGDFILDNRNDDIKDYRKTGYKFVMRQSQTGHGWDRVD